MLRHSTLASQFREPHPLYGQVLNDSLTLRSANGQQQVQPTVGYCFRSISDQFEPLVHVSSGIIYPQANCRSNTLIIELLNSSSIL